MRLHTLPGPVTLEPRDGVLLHGTTNTVATHVAQLRPRFAKDPENRAQWQNNRAHCLKSRSTSNYFARLISNPIKYRCQRQLIRLSLTRYLNTAQKAVYYRVSRFSF